MNDIWLPLLNNERAEIQLGELLSVKLTTAVGNAVDILKLRDAVQVITALTLSSLLV